MTTLRDPRTRQTIEETLLLCRRSREHLWLLRTSIAATAEELARWEESIANCANNSEPKP